MKCFFAVGLLALGMLMPTASYAHGGSHGSHGSHAHKARVRHGTEHVAGYTRKDGTYVQGYDRSEKGSYGESDTGSYGTSYDRGHMADGYAAHPTVSRGMFGRIKRSGAEKNAFKRQQPCPSNGSTSGKCPGYVIDHVKPLECGGADLPVNMEWQTIADGKAKDKTERFCR
jgi:hypothetical protein